MFSLPHLGSEIQKVTFMFLSLYVADNDGDAAGSRTALISSKRIMMMMTAHHIHAKTERVLCCAAARLGTFTHPYLLADNRHLTFYLWKDVLGASPWARYALAPASAASLLALFRALSARRGRAWAACAMAAAAASFVPSGLLELRYFTVPVMLFGVTAWGRRSRGAGGAREWAVAATAAGFAAVDAAVVGLFLGRPFFWPDGTLQRFMW